MRDFQAAFNRLDEYVEQQREEFNTPGVAIAITDREKLLRVSTYGYANLDAQIPITPSSLFEFGSIGKCFAATVMLQLHEAGRVDLRTPITQYLPWFHVPSDFEPITVHHILTHTSGLGAGSDATPGSAHEIWALREWPAPYPPGQQFHYSNVGYKTLGFLVEHATGRPYHQWVQTGILDPLGMADTDPLTTHETRKRLAIGYEPWYDDRPWHRSHPMVPVTWLEYGMSDGSLSSTAADLAAFLRMLLNRGRGPQGPMLSPESFALMTTPLIRRDEDLYGYGMRICYRDGHTYIGHLGGTVGFHSAMWGNLDEGLGVVVFLNNIWGLGKPRVIAEYALSLLRAAGGRQDLPPLPAAADPAKVDNAADYAGQYIGDEQSLTLVAEGNTLLLQHRGARVVLERRGPDRFYVNHPDFSLFLLSFQREGGRVVEAFYGGDWFIHARYSGPKVFEVPAEWRAYPGHYRSHNPWMTNFRVVVRKDRLMLIYDDSADTFEIPLAQLDRGVFRLGVDPLAPEYILFDSAAGADPFGPERIRFDSVVEGRALRANLFGSDCYRTFTP